MIQPGEVYMVDLPDGGRHPGIVVSREELNRGGYVVVVICTSAGFHRRRSLPNCVPLRAGRFGFRTDCVAQCENVGAIERSLLDEAGGPIGLLDDGTLREVIRAIGYVMEAECEPA